jgi:hypothetical protein
LAWAIENNQNHHILHCLGWTCSSAGEAGWVKLAAEQKSFEKGAVDAFHLKLPDVGAVSALQVTSSFFSSLPAMHSGSWTELALP